MRSHTYLSSLNFKRQNVKISANQLVDNTIKKIKKFSDLPAQSKLKKSNTSFIFNLTRGKIRQQDLQSW